MRVAEQPAVEPAPAQRASQGFGGHDEGVRVGGHDHVLGIRHQVQ